jgi:CheY-like chemotaxis protein
LLVVDGHMPGMDGFMLLEKIRADQDLKVGEIMMLTSGEQLGDIQRCKELAVSEYLIKPIAGAELLASILKTLGHGRVQDSETPVFPSVKHLARPEEPLRILLAEDNMFNQKVATGMLGRLGHSVTIANNGREAVESFANGRYDMVLMDIQMPEMDGFRATDLIRQQQQRSGVHTPIIAMTAHAMAGDREKCLAAGMDDYISKPISREELFRVLERNSAQPDHKKQAGQRVDTVRRALTGHTKEVMQGPNDEGDKKLSTATAFSNHAPIVIVADAVLARCGGDPELLAALAGMFPEESHKILHDLKQARASGDVTGVQLHAHSLKGMCNTFEARDAANAAFALEECAREGDLGTDGQLELLTTELDRAIDAVTQLVASKSD